MSKRALKSKNSKSGPTKQLKQSEMHDVNASLVMLSHATEAGSDADRQKLTVDKYVHKKFKRIASASFDDNFGQEKHPNSVGTDIQLHINEPPLTTNDISQSVSSDQPDSDDISNKSTTCLSERPVASSEPHKPYKPKFHKVCSMLPAEYSSENVLLQIPEHGNRSPIDYSKKPSDSMQQQTQMTPPKDPEPLNLTNRRKLQAVEPLHGINSICNPQSATYLDEPIPSPGPFLGKTRLVDDHGRRRASHQTNQTVNNFANVNPIGVNGTIDQSVLQRPIWSKEVNQSFPIAGKTIDLNIISSTSEFEDHTKLASDPVRMVVSPMDSMQIAEVSSSVNTSLTAIAEPHSKRTPPPPPPTEGKLNTAGNIASEYIELINKQIHSTTNDEHAKRSPIVPIRPPAHPIPITEESSKGKSSRPNVSFIPNGDGPSQCTLCSASFPKSSLLKMHMNIHYMNPERKFNCDSCGKSFRTQNRLQKHTCFETKVVSKPNNKNPRPFKCSDCDIAFRGHGFLAKHLRSKTHIQNLENLQKIPNGTYAMIEKAQINLSDIDTTDCDSSLESLKILAKKLNVDQNDE